MATLSCKRAWVVEFSQGLDSRLLVQWGLLLTESRMDTEGEVFAVLHKLLPKLSRLWCPHWQHEMLMHLLRRITRHGSMGKRMGSLDMRSPSPPKPCSLSPAATHYGTFLRGAGSGHRPSWDSPQRGTNRGRQSSSLQI